MAQQHKMALRSCEECGTPFLTRASRVREGKGRFCSRACAAKWVGREISPYIDRSGEKNGNWKGGVSRDNYRYKLRQVKRYPKRVEARRLVYQAVKSGKLTRGACEDCGSTKSVQAHHEDYRKPLEVIWLCRPCHRARHDSERRKAA